MMKRTMTLKNLIQEERKNELRKLEILLSPNSKALRT